MNSDLKFWNAINLNPKIGPAKFKKIYTRFKTMEEAWNASALDLKKCGLEEKDIEYFLIKRQEVNPDLEFEKIENEKIKIVTIRDKNYPKLLKEIYLPPPLLYVKGDLEKEIDFTLGVVGTRKPTLYGKEITSEIVKNLVLSGITIVSGLAYGVDTEAHRIAVELSKKTIAVLGSGIDQESIYPTNNRRLAEKIINTSGAVISEYPYGTLPLKQHFPARNRIIAGLSLGVLVTEAPKESGALITANCALEQNREVFAVPGAVFNKNTEGPHNLIKMGAKLITSAVDILEELNLSEATKFIANKKIVPESKEEEKILLVLSKEPIHIDLIAQKTELTIETVSATLTLMEMKGKVKNLGNMQYIVAR
jgi:DNA processing protein